MELRVDRSQFLAELALMQGIVERRTTIPVLSHILLRGNGERLSIAATDLDVSLTSWCEAEVDGEGAIAVQARKFTEIIRAVVGDKVRLLLEDEKRLAIIAGKSKFKINGLSAEDFPTLPEVEGAGVSEVPYAQFRSMIGKVIFAVSAEETRFQLNGALLKLDAGKMGVVATDGHRLAIVENAFEGTKSDDGVLVPRKALQELLRFEGETSVNYRRGEHHLSFGLGRRELICRILEGTFPDYERVISKDNDKSALFAAKDLASAVQRVALLTGDRSRAIKLAFRENQLQISAANPDLGEALEEVDCEYEGPEFQIGVNPDYIGQFLSVIGTEQVRFELKDENSQCIGIPVDGVDSRYLCVIMPMRV